MRLSAWQQRSARVVLVTFTTCIVACGGSSSETSTTTTTATATSTTVTLPPTTAPPPPAPPPTLAQPPQRLNKQELRDLVAPVALYPDVVLSSLLPATTNPEQIHDAAQFVGDAAHVDHVPEDRGWDGSVVALVQFPDVLRWLDENPAWTDEMGQAVTYQQGDVLDAIQDYRRLAKDVGNLKSNRYQTVRGDPGQDIRIDPARPDVVYVPSYDPALATQPQPPPDTPGINPWIVFGGGAVVGALGAWALYSIFDSDHEHVTNNYYGGGGGRRIRRFDNYYYSGKQRPREVDWAPRQHATHEPARGWQQPRRLRQSAATPPAGRPAPLRPPTRGGGSAPSPGEVRREQRQENQQLRQQQRQEQRQQRPQNRQERQQERRDQRQQRQELRQQQNQGQRQQRQEQRQQQREQRQERRQGRQDQRQEQRQERQDQRQQRREQRQEQRQERRQERRQNGGDQQKPNKKKRKAE